MKLCLQCHFQFEDGQDLCPKDYSKLVPVGKDQLIGTLIHERFRIDSVIAKGSMGVVYKATQELIGREVAIKVLHGYLVADEESVQRFQQEAKAASKLNHPNITTLYDYGMLGSGQPYIVMDLLRGSSLADVIQQRGCLPLDESLPIFQQVCDALTEAHKQGVVHRDIKPENIMLDYTDKGVNAKVVDFGIAKFLQEQGDTLSKITKTGTVCGSPTYMSPEQCDDSKVDNRSDIYSLGVVAYETLTGKVPFSGTDIYAVMSMHVKDQPPPLNVARPDLVFPPHLQNVIDQVLSKNPDDRYQTAIEFFDALKGKGTVKSEAKTSSPCEDFPNVHLMGISPASLFDSGSGHKKVCSADESPDSQFAYQEPARPTIDPEMVRKKIQAAAAELENRRSQQTKSEMPPRRPKVDISIRLLGLLQQLFPALLTLSLTAALFWVIGNQATIQAILSRHYHIPSAMQTKDTADNSLDVDDLITQKKYDQVRSILEEKRKQGTLSNVELTTLNALYTRLSKKEAKAKRYTQAVALLEMISGEDKNDEEVLLLLKKYKHSAGIR